jgi:proteic killer suppression protein
LHGIVIDNCSLTGYNKEAMIKSFKHKGLEKLFLKNDTSGVNPEHIEKIENILLSVDSASNVKDLDLVGYKLHKLKGNMKNLWSITVRANWRITFIFEKGDAYVLDYQDYH